jgi:hypothetical protein
MQTDRDRQSSFGSKVEKFSEFRPEFTPLAGLLTGRYPPRSEHLTWSDSTKVDVIVVDLKRLPEPPFVEHVKDIMRLNQVAKLDVPESVAMRLFLVEDVTAPVIEVLGKAYDCYFSFFSEHLQTIEPRAMNIIDDQGLPTADTGDMWVNRGIPQSRSKIIDSPFFSLPFRRNFFYADKEEQDRHVGQRTIFRHYNDENFTLEERTTGALHPTTSGNSSIAILLFDSNGSTDGTYHSLAQLPLFDTFPRFSTTETLPTHMEMGSSLMRICLLKQLVSEGFLGAILEDHSTILCAVLQSMLGAWLEVVHDNAYNTRLQSSDQHHRESSWILWHLMDEHRHRQQGLEMLKKSLTVIRARGCEFFRSKPGTQAEAAMKRLEVDFTDLISQTERQLALIERRLATLASMRSIHESEKAMKQSEYMGALTSLATLYIPLSFVSTFLGMNVKEISQQGTSLWVFFAIAIPLSLITILTLAKWNTLLTVRDYLFAPQGRKSSRTRGQRWMHIVRVLYWKFFVYTRYLDHRFRKWLGDLAKDDEGQAA